MVRRLKSLLMLAGVGLACSTGTVPAQEFPNRPVTLMVGLAPGGITDITARIYADAAAKIFGQRVVVENRTGAGGGVAAAAVQNAAPDGTPCWCSPGPSTRPYRRLAMRRTIR
jgi:tripartite-type tricarboxylate transporter receptor subunit TctC